MKKEELQALGLDEEQVAGIFKLNGLDIEDLKSKHNALETQLDQAREELKERDTQLENLKANAGNSEELQARIKELQEDNANKAKEFEEKLHETQFNSELEKALLQANVRDINIARAAFNLDDISLEEGKLKGFDEQLNTIKENHAYLFADTIPAGTGGSFGNGAKDRKTWNSKEDILSIKDDEERINAIQENLELFD